MSKALEVCRLSARDCALAIVLAAWIGAGCAAPHRTSTEDAPRDPAAPAEDRQWVLHATGVGELVPGAPIPASVYSREGASFDALWTRPVRGLGEEEQAVQGFRDQEGYPLVTFPALDVVARLAHNDTLLGIWVGPSVRTAEGTGVGSTQAELEAAHGQLRRHDIPEPYHCAVASPALAQVTFLFRARCSNLLPSTPCAAVYVGGGDDAARQTHGVEFPLRFAWTRDL